MAGGGAWEGQSILSSAHCAAMQATVAVTASAGGTSNMHADGTWHASLSSYHDP